MKKVLFIDRDGTLVIEPPVDFQLDSLEKLEFYPGVFQWLSKIVNELDYELVMVTNQDGLGTNSFPEDTFWPAQNKIIQAFKNEGIVFQEVCIDRSFESENLPTRKPATGMLSKYIYGAYDLEKSYVIGDRVSDIKLAQNLGSKGILIGNKQNADAELTTTDWKEIYQYLSSSPRTSALNRKTNETNIDVALNLDGTGKCEISTGIGFFDHMLEQIGKHGCVDMKIAVEGDLFIDEHHTVEDVAICVGEALREALGDKAGVRRFASGLYPLDEALVEVALDLSGRAFVAWNVELPECLPLGNPAFDPSLAEHAVSSLASAAAITLHVNLRAGRNVHHIIEATFKGLARCLRDAVRIESAGVPSTKGVLS